VNKWRNKIENWKWVATIRNCNCELKLECNSSFKAFHIVHTQQQVESSTLRSLFTSFAPHTADQQLPSCLAPPLIPFSLHPRWLQRCQLVIIFFSNNWGWLLTYLPFLFVIIIWVCVLCMRPVCKKKKKKRKTERVTIQLYKLLNTVYNRIYVCVCVAATIIVVIYDYLLCRAYHNFLYEVRRLLLCSFFVKVFPFLFYVVLLICCTYILYVEFWKKY